VIKLQKFPENAGKYCTLFVKGVFQPGGRWASKPKGKAVTQLCGRRILEGGNGCGNGSGNGGITQRLHRKIVKLPNAVQTTSLLSELGSVGGCYGFYVSTGQRCNNVHANARGKTPGKANVCVPVPVIQI